MLTELLNIPTLTAGFLRTSHKMEPSYLQVEFSVPLLPRALVRESKLFRASFPLPFPGLSMYLALSCLCTYFDVKK